MRRPADQPGRNLSAATGQATRTLNDLRVVWGYEQVLWVNASGGVMVVAFARSSDSAGILPGGTYTPIPWTPQTAAAWWPRMRGLQWRG